MENNILVIATPKLKVVAMKWVTTKCGIELKVEGKEDCIKKFMAREVPEKIEHANELEEF